MANIKISDLPSASLPLDGTEEIPLVQSGTTVKATTLDLVDASLAVTVANLGGTPAILSDTLSNRPLAASFGTIFIDTSPDYQVYQYNGSNWTLLAQTKLPYRSYVAVITQSGTSAPTEDYLLYSDLGFTPTFGYVSPGIYSVNSSFGWTNLKTAVILTPGYMPTGFGVDAGVALGWQRTSSSVIQLKSKKTSDDTDTNDLINKATIEIRIYS